MKGFHDRTHYEDLIKWAASERGRIWLKQLEQKKNDALSAFGRFLVLLAAIGIVFTCLFLAR